MNVDDVAVTLEYPADKLADIVRRQTELMQKYHHIEKANGLLQTDIVPVDIHDRFGQARLKDFAWRVTEEIAEATEAMIIHADIPQHALEELGDALHFMIELDILSGIDFDQHIVGACNFDHECGLERLYHSLPRLDEPLQLGSMPNSVGVSIVRDHAYSVVESLGKAMNCLKQKPWKQTHLLTDRGKYIGHLAAANRAFFLLCFTLMDAKGVYDVYCRKGAVNQFRIRSKY